MLAAFAKFFGLLTRGLNTLDNIVAVGELHSESLRKKTEVELSSDLRRLERELAALEQQAQ